jgi:hypothetical protein
VYTLDLIIVERRVGMDWNIKSSVTVAHEVSYEKIL